MSPYVDALSRARRVAIVGDSPVPQRYGHAVLRAFCDAGYDVVAVNPKYGWIHGPACPLLKSFPSIAALPVHVDLVVLVLPPGRAQRVLPELSAAGIDTVWLPPATSTPDGVRLARALGLTTVEGLCPVQVLSGQVHPDAPPAAAPTARSGRRGPVANRLAPVVWGTDSPDPIG